MRYTRPLLAITAARGGLALTILAGVGCKTVDSNRGAAVQFPAPIQEPSSASTTKSAEQLFSAGTAAYEAGRFDEARLLFGEALERSPGMVSAQYNLAVLAERQNETSRAASIYESVLQKEPGHVPSVLNLARIRLRAGEPDAAVDLLEQACRQPDPKYELALMNALAAAYRSAKKYSKAEATSRAVLSKYGDDVEALKNLALAYYEQGRFHLAELVETSAAKLNPNDAAVHNDLGLVYLKLGRASDAAVEFRRAIELDPKLAVAHRNLGALAFEYRDYPTAEKSFAALASLDPSSCEARLYFAHALEAQQSRAPSKAAAAGAQYEEALAIERNNSEGICGAARVYSRDRENWSKALQYLERCKSLASTSSSERLKLESTQKALIAASQSSANPTPELDRAEPAPSSGADDGAQSEAAGAGGNPRGGQR